MDATKPGNTPPPKPWVRPGTSSGPTPFKPPSPGSTSAVVEASGSAKPGEIVSNTERNASVNRNTFGRPTPARPWEQNNGNSYGGYGSSMNYNSGYGSGMYNSYGGSGGSYGGSGGAYGGGLHGNSMYRGGYGGQYGGSGMYGGSMYNNGFGGPMGGYGMGMGGPNGNQDPNNPYGPPPSPPGFWISFLRVMHGVVNCFGRISVLIEQNSQAFQFFMSALLQLFDRSGLLYGELARFALRLLGVRRKPKRHSELSGPPDAHGQNHIAGPKGSSGSWDSVWGDGDRRTG